MTTQTLLGGDAMELSDSDRIMLYEAHRRALETHRRHMAGDQPDSIPLRVAGCSAITAPAKTAARMVGDVGTFFRFQNLPH